MLLALWSSVSVDGGPGYCPPSVINRQIYFASHWEFLLPALGTGRHKSPECCDVSTQENNITAIMFFLPPTRMMKSLVLNTKAITPITIRKHWIWFQEEKTLFVWFNFEKPGAEACAISMRYYHRYNWYKRGMRHIMLLSLPIALSVSVTLCSPAWRPLHDETSLEECITAPY